MRRLGCSIAVAVAFTAAFAATVNVGVGSARSSSPAHGGFAVLNVVGSAPDFTDPALAYNGASWQLGWNVYVGLVGYPHLSGPHGAALVPYLAAAMPQMSAGGKVFTFRLRAGIRFSNGAIVKASDFQCSIERLFKMDSPGVGFYNAIAGVSGPSGYAASPQGHISGITVDDKQGRITVKLEHPQADFLNTLALPFAAVVPCATPASDQSDVGVPSAGPYMVKQYEPNREVDLTRNPAFSQRKLPMLPHGNPDEIDYQIVADPTLALNEVMSSVADYDAESLPVDRLGEVTEKYAAQLKVASSANTAWFFMNTRTAPFNKLAARQAVNYAIDRDALVRLLGGLAQPTENILPPSYPQYRKITTYKHDLAKARRLVLQSGTAGMKVDVWGSSSSMSRPAVEYLADVLSAIGWKADVKVIASSVYWSTIGNETTNAQIGYAAWGQDYPNPIDWLDVLFNGDRITPTHNNNYGNADFPDVNRLIDKLKTTAATTPRQDTQWATVERLLIGKYAAVAPYASLVMTDFFSTRMDMSCYRHHVLYGFDMANACVK